MNELPLKQPPGGANTESPAATAAAHLPLPTSSLGIPVAVEQIDGELKKLWEESGGFATRASLINLALYCEGKDTLGANTDLIARIAEDHACRAILICVEPQAPETKVQAWISAHCHLTRAGAKQVCSEQITFLLEGPSRSLIPNIVFSHLDTDLPLYLWWQGEFPDPIDSQLWTWVDRLIFDSSEWRDKCRQLQLLRDSLSESQHRLVLCDLNWTRSLFIRQALSSLFDHPENLAHIHRVNLVTITHAPEYRCTALLFAGWLATQLRWKRSEDAANGAIAFQSERGLPVRVVLRGKAGAPISECSLTTGDATFGVCRQENSAYLHSSVVLPDGRRFSALLPAGKEECAALFNEELMGGGHHRVYLHALEFAEKLF